MDVSNRRGYAKIISHLQDELCQLDPSDENGLYDPLAQKPCNRYIPLRIWLKIVLGISVYMTTLDIVYLITGYQSVQADEISMRLFVILGVMMNSVFSWMLSLAAASLAPHVINLVRPDIFFGGEKFEYGITSAQMKYCVMIPFEIFSCWGEGEHIDENDWRGQLKHLAVLVLMFLALRWLCTIQIT